MKWVNLVIAIIFIEILVLSLHLDSMTGAILGFLFGFVSQVLPSITGK